MQHYRDTLLLYNTNPDKKITKSLLVITLLPVSPKQWAQLKNGCSGSNPLLAYRERMGD